MEDIIFPKTSPIAAIFMSFIMRLNAFIDYFRSRAAKKDSRPKVKKVKHMVKTIQNQRLSAPASMVKEKGAKEKGEKRRVLYSIHMLAAGLIFSMALIPPALARSAPESFANLADTLLPSVVNISTTQKIQSDESTTLPPYFNIPQESPLRDFFEHFSPKRKNPKRPITSLGSGFIIDKSGIIVTNNHVIEGADEITVILQDDTELPAKLIGSDPRTDIAVLKVDSDEPLPAAPFGDSDKARVGDWVLAIGNPMGLGGTVTAGIISARGRDISSGPYDDYIQTDASINRGNSGGPLFNMQGEVIGINTAIFSNNGGSIGIAFAVPSTQAKQVIKQLREFGTTRRGWLGVVIQEVTDGIAEGLGRKDTQGALVSSVYKDSPAGEAGIKQGDIIIRFNGETVPNSRQLPRMVANTPVNTKVPVEIWRNHEKNIIFVTLGELEKSNVASLTPDNAPNKQGIETLGMTLVGVTPNLAKHYGLKDPVQGVLITNIDENSDAYRKQIRPGDLIAEAHQHPVSTPQEIEKLVEDARKEGKKSILLLVKQNNEARFVAIEIKEK